MYEDRIQFALDEFIKQGYFEPQSKDYILKETVQGGKTDLKITVTGDNLVRQSFDKEDHISFLSSGTASGMEKAVDHVIFQKTEEGWKAHLIEMKSTMRSEKWKDIRLQFRSSYFKMRTLALYLGIDIQSVQAYITYEKEKFSSKEPIADVAEKKKISGYLGHLGYRAINPKEEWESRKMTFSFGEDKLILAHTPIQMQRSADGSKLIGEYQL